MAAILGGQEQARTVSMDGNYNLLVHFITEALLPPRRRGPTTDPSTLGAFAGAKRAGRVVVVVVAVVVVSVLVVIVIVFGIAIRIVVVALT